jgi:hypothetical protein
MQHGAHDLIDWCAMPQRIERQLCNLPRQLPIADTTR